MRFGCTEIDGAEDVNVIDGTGAAAQPCLLLKLDANALVPVANTLPPTRFRRRAEFSIYASLVSEQEASGQSIAARIHPSAAAS